MRVRILLQIALDDGAFGAAEEVATLVKGAGRLEEVGLSLADSKAVLAGLQRRLVGLQAAARVEAVDQVRWDGPHAFRGPVVDEIRGNHQQSINLVITKGGQGLALMITIIRRIHEDRQVACCSCRLQRRVQHGY